MLFGDAVNDAAVTVRVTEAVLVTPLPVTVIVALLVPTAAVVMFTLAVTVPFSDPDDGLTVSQEALLLAVQLPLEVTVTT